MVNYFDQIEPIVRKELTCSAHNMDHVMRVYKNVLNIAEGESVDHEVLIPAVLLHDIAKVREDQDNSGVTDHSILGAEMAESILVDLHFPPEKIAAIKHCISTHRFRGDNEPETPEAKILFDADKVDIVGAIGIARSFMLAGQFNQAIFSCVSLDEYARDNLVGGKRNGRIIDISKHTPDIHFETKIRQIHDRLYTERGRKLAKERIEFMEKFFARLEQEIAGKL